MGTQENRAKVGRQDGLLVWPLGVLCVAALLFAGMCPAQYAPTWSDLNSYTLHAYKQSELHAWQSASNDLSYNVVYVDGKHGQHLFARPNEIKMVAQEVDTIGCEFTVAAKTLARIGDGADNAKGPHVRITELNWLINPYAPAQGTGALDTLKMIAVLVTLLPAKSKSGPNSAQCRGPSSAISGFLLHSRRKHA